MAAARLEYFEIRPQGRLAHPRPERRVRDDLVGECHGGIDDLPVGHGLEDESDAGGLLARDPASGQDQLGGAGSADDALQQPAETQLCAGGADLHEGVDEQGGGGGVAKVGPQGERVAGARCGAVDGRDDRLRHGAHAGDDLGHVLLLVHVGLKRAYVRGHPRRRAVVLQIVAGTEAFPGPGQHDHPAVRVTPELLEGVVDLVQHVGGQCVQVVRSVERHQRNAVM